MIPIGRVRELVRYPVKSMAGVPVESAELGWHGLAGDRRFAFRRLGESSGFPWLTAGRLPELLLYQPFGLDHRGGEPLPTHVRTPAGVEVALRSEALQRELSGRFGSPVEVMQINHGIFDDAPVSVIAWATVTKLAGDAKLPVDPRRMRANVLIETDDPVPFGEDDWVGGTLFFGDGEAAVSVTARDIRCMMINLDPDTATQNAQMMKSAVRLNNNNAGVYGTVVRAGKIQVGQRVSLIRYLPR
ncbi:MAG: MOSC domain-containing protein [Gemmatimonadaceae bacterium]|jgi:hypothetical protein|nr:MOSC domain-containing protein [Gemmatimonadaceae bacterium]